MERPGLKKLLEDIAAKRVDTVVVYKVDRLTRSLADFAKIVDQFDKQGVSFVSVTQQFNTTTSMGRLTLNVLLQLRSPFGSHPKLASDNWRPVTEQRLGSGRGHGWLAGNPTQTQPLRNSMSVNWSLSFPSYRSTK